MLTFTNVRKAYGSIVAVADLSIALARGEVLGLLGPNGAGKSTTVGLAVGLLAPDRGTIAIEGAGSPTDPAARKRLGVAPQALALYEMLTGEENLRFFARTYGLTTAAIAERVGWSLEFVGLAERGRDRVQTYSGGMKRRLNLAAAIVHDPDLILLDEPTVGVDPQSRNQIMENILTLKRKGRTIVYATHYMEEAERLCDRVAVIDRGKLLALGAVGALLEAHGSPPVMVEKRSSLEEVFLHLTGRSLRD